MSIDALLSRLQHVRPSGKDKWRAQCPLHDKGRDALAIRDDGGTILVHCFSCGGSAFDICSAVGTDISDLMPERVDPIKPRKGIVKPWPSKQVLEALHRDIRLAYVLFSDIQRGTPPLEMNRERAKAAKERMSHLINELDRSY